MNNTFEPAVKDAAQIVAEPTQAFWADSARVADIAAAFEAVSREEQADSPRKSKLLKRAKSLLLRYRVDRNKSLQSLAIEQRDRTLQRVPAAKPGETKLLKEQISKWESLMLEATKSLVGAQAELKKTQVTPDTAQRKTGSSNAA